MKNKNKIQFFYTYFFYKNNFIKIRNETHFCSKFKNNPNPRRTKKPVLCKCFCIIPATFVLLLKLGLFLILQPRNCNRRKDY